MNEGKLLKAVFAANLVYLRMKAGISQRGLAERSGLTQNFINDLEHHKKSASFITIERLSEALDAEPFQSFFTPASGTAKTPVCWQYWTTSKKASTKP